MKTKPNNAALAKNMSMPLIHNATAVQRSQTPNNSPNIKLENSLWMKICNASMYFFTWNLVHA